MSSLRVLIGKFGRIALLKMSHPVVEHAHPHAHILVKSFGHDATFFVRGEKCRLTDRTALLINAWEPHSYAPDAGAPDTVVLVLYIEPRWLIEARSAARFAGPSPVCLANRQARVLPRARQLVRLMTDLLLGMSEVDAEEVDSLLFSLIVATVGRNGLVSATRVARPQADLRIRRAIAQLRGHVGSPLAVDEIANVVGLSRPHFFALFRRCTGVTPGMFANMLRMEEAIRRLSIGDQSVGELAFELGFGAHSNFTRFFRQHQGVAPAEFRRAVDVVGDAYP